MDHVRCFIALDLPHEMSQILSSLSAQLAQNLTSVRWVAPGNHHLTLQFLGDVEVGRLEAVAEASDRAAAGHSPLRVAFDVVGGFPSPDRAKVIWQGIAGDLFALTALQADLAAELAGIGFERDGRAFRPHLTLGRSRRPVALPEYDAESSGVFELRRVSLIQSDLGRGGARYTPLHAAILKKRSGSS